jgi:hypothetical protein
VIGDVCTGSDPMAANGHWDQLGLTSELLVAEHAAMLREATIGNAASAHINSAAAVDSSMAPVESPIEK